MDAEVWWVEEAEASYETAGSRVPLRARTKQYALRILKMSASLPSNRLSDMIGNQVMRSGTSVGACYREACRARSDAEFISKIETALQELDESGYWLELLAEAGLLPEARLADLRRETDELIAILTTCVLRVKQKKR